MNKIIEIKNLEKKFDIIGKNTKTVFKDLNLDIIKDETLAIVGPNGSGKTTLLNILIGLINKTSGEVVYSGYKNKKDFINSMGIQFQSSDFPKGFRTSEIIDLVYELNNIKPKGITYSKWLKEFRNSKKKKLVKLFNLEDKLNRIAVKMSGGEQQRLNVLLALLNNPKFLIIDEITTGLDLKAQAKIINYIKKYSEKKQNTLIIVSHNLHQIDLLADRIAILDKNKIIGVYSREEIIKKYKSIPLFLNDYFKISKGELL